VECQHLIAQLPVLLEDRTAQHRFSGQALLSGRFDAASIQVSRHHAKQIAMLVQPLRHRLQLAADLVRGEKIESAGLDGAFLAHCRFRRWQDLDSVA
jgi:hypothetical protein